jgi:hypothetical protein
VLRHDAGGVKIVVKAATGEVSRGWPTLGMYAVVAIMGAKCGDDPHVATTSVGHSTKNI